MMLKRWGIAAALMAALGVAFWLALPDARPPVREGGHAIDFSLPDLNGNAHSLPKGEVVLLNFWATWCPPCRQEMPSMARLHERLAAKGLHVVAVSIDRNSAELAGFVRENRIPFQVLHDPESRVSRQYGVFKYPESFLIDRHGVIRYHLVGAVDWMSEPVLKAVEALLAEPRGARADG